MFSLGGGRRVEKVDRGYFEYDTYSTVKSSCGKASVHSGEEAVPGGDAVVPVVSIMVLFLVRSNWRQIARSSPLSKLICLHSWLCCRPVGV